MPLQIRRGTTAQRLSITPLPGELILDTDTNLVYVGDGSTPGGNVVVSPPSIDTEVAITAAGNALVAGEQENIIFTYGPVQDAANRIDARVDLSNYTGEIQADAFRGNLYAEDSSLVFDSTTNTITVSTLAASNITADVVVSDIVGSVFSNNSTVLVDANDASINLDGTVKGDIIPDQNEVYDIGSASNRFKDLYLSGTSINLGSAQITSVGSAINLPTGSTVNGVPIGSGTGTGDGVIEGSSYKINIVSESSTIMVNSDTGQLVGNLTGNVTGNLTGIVTGNILGNVIGNVTGDILGFHIGDSKGSVFADDSTILVDGTNGSIPAEVVQGTFTGNVIGNLTGNVVGDVIGTLQGDVIKNSGTLVISTGSGNVVIGSTSLGHQGNFTIVRNNYDSSPFAGFTFQQHHDTPDSVNFSFFRSRGTFTSLAIVQDGDDLIDIVATGYDGAQRRPGASISAIVDGTPSATIIPTRLEFATHDGSTFATRARLEKTGTLSINNIQGYTTALTVTGNLIGNVTGDVKGSVFANDSSMIIDGTEGGRITSSSVTVSEFLQLPNYANDAARLAAIPSPVQGMVIFMQAGTTPAATNQPQYFDGSNWQNL